MAHPTTGRQVAPRPVVPFPGRAPETSFAGLPTPLSPLVGRRREVEEVSALLQRPDVRLLTVTGPGGVGKTRLAIAAAERSIADFADGVAFVALAPVRDPTLVIPTVAHAVGVHDAGKRPLAGVLTAALRPRRLLLILDNFEQILPAAPDVAALLMACPGLKVLATSRAVLRISGEYDYPVPPLSLGRGGEQARSREARDPLLDASTPRLLASSEAVELFVERARAANPTFSPTAADAGAIAEICRRLDCLPLAIELAAARLRHLPLDALLARLGQRLPLLTGGARDQPARLRTMRDAVAWSYDLLTDDERRLFRRLSVFAGGFTLEAAEAVAERTMGRWGEEAKGGRSIAPSPDRPIASVLDGLAALIDQSLLRAEGTAAGEPRYGMLETIREFGLDELAASGEEDDVRRRHAAQFFDLVERAWPAISARAGQERWLASLAADHDNLRAALDWLVASGDANAALRLAGNLYWVWLMRGYLGEGRAWLERALAMPGSRDAPPPVRALALLALGTLVHFQGDDAAAVPIAEEALRLARAGRFAYGVAMSLLLIGTILEDQGRYDEALPVTEEALAGCRELGNRADEALALFHLAAVTWGLGDLNGAVALGERALVLSKAIGDRWAMGVTLNLLGLLLGLRGEHDRSAALLLEGLRLGREVGAQRELAAGLANAAVLAAACGEPTVAARLFGAEEATRATVGSDWNLPERAVYEQTVAAARRALGERPFAAAWAAGRAASLDEMIAIVEALPGSTPASTAAATEPDRHARLSRRELEVLRLVAAGRNNAEIAAALFITPGTVRIHVSNILAKLGARTRTEAAAMARARGLV